MSNPVKVFNAYRQQSNEKIFEQSNKIIKRYFNLDNNAYQQGALSAKVKEMLGLVSSLVLRCEDCVKYHLGKCKEEGLTTEELHEIFSIALLVDGSVVIPYMRKAVEYWEALNKC